ncbi:precorrin-6y C5,15-methyltransferase (decarboxylating) subunit CbiE [Marinomonas agarivorans]|nr:precorrin-6y C5,15-methyltransferase (decarboxylating) subunit CbiE [Marinomonas agarivorans]
MNQLIIHVVGLGVQANAKLDEYAEMALLKADCVLGSERQLNLVSSYLSKHKNRHNDDFCQILPTLPELEAKLQVLQEKRFTDVVVLASGDPLYFGIGTWLNRHFSAHQIHFYPAVSSIQAACHKLGVTLQDAHVLSVHGRPVESIRRQLKPNRNLILLTDSKSTPQVLAQECIDAGLTKSILHICEALGYESERIRSFTAEELVRQAELGFDALNVVVIKTSNQPSFYPNFPGIADNKFVTDKGNGKGMLTKRETRLSILSLLQISDKDIVWDVGAGCGGVAIEIGYWHPQANVFAVEHNEIRQSCLEANRTRFGVMNNVTLIAAKAPEALQGLPKPDKVFVGGSDGNLEKIIEYCWDNLPENGVLVTSAVTEDTKMTLQSFLQKRIAKNEATYESIQLNYAKLENLAEQSAYRPALPVTLFCFTKQLNRTC